MSIRSLILVLPAYPLWLVVFRTEFLNFWARILIAVSLLILIAFVGRPGLLESRPRIKLRMILLGIASGLLFYWLLYFGYLIFKPLVIGGAEEVYALRHEAPRELIALILIFTSFGEEIYWRGFVQQELQERLGGIRGLLSASAIYSSVHVWTLNLPLMFIALVMGLCWGAIYLKTKSLQSVILSHIIWTELVFVFLPLT
ncbi:MAG: type II CAAX endopeptidase family protein [Nitrososphaerota archaeon]|nr:CPBP family intramembrane metalloprotease [Aigarchaeota archaeon]MDW8077131.1 type II CAAX endopeptidase family protein [Nitrososphaerota archaeon]